MLFDELQEQLKALEPDIGTIKEYWSTAGIEKKFNTLEQISQQEDFWQHPDQIKILQELQRLRTLKEQYNHIIRSYADLNELINLFQNEDAELEKVRVDIRSLSKAASSYKVGLLLNDPQDESNCFLSINSGAGGTESQDWTSMLVRMYVRFCEREKLSVQVLDYQVGEEAGIKSATLFIKGNNPYGLLKSEIGIHRLVRISPFDSNKRRHTSFAAVSAIPETPEVEVTIDPGDLRIDTYRAGGAGGQHVNKTDSAVRITHIPTNIVVQCQNERSQMQNKGVAMKMLQAKLAQRAKEEQEASLPQAEKKKIEWGSQIRSYVLHPYKMAKDHRTNVESQQPDLVLDGDIMPFIEAYLIWISKPETA